MLRERTDRAWFSCLLRHPVMKWNGAILITPETAWGTIHHAAVLIILTLYPAADNHHKHVILMGGEQSVTNCIIYEVRWLTFRVRSRRGMRHCSGRPWTRLHRPSQSCRCYRRHWLAVSVHRSPVPDVDIPGPDQTHNETSPAPPTASTSALTAHTQPVTSHSGKLSLPSFRGR